MPKTKGQLPKAYLRLDPNIDQTHPDPGAMVKLMCVANRQPHRGHFKTRALLETILGSRPVKGYVDRGDIVQIEDGRWYVPGWQEWQEGDWMVAERQRRIRDRRNAATVTEPLPDRDNSTDSSLPDRRTTPRHKAARQQGSKASTTSANARDGSGDLIALIEELTDRPFGYSVGSKVWDTLAADLRDLGAGKLSAAYRATKQDAGGKLLDGAGLVFGTHNRLYEIPASTSKPKGQKPKGMLPSVEEVNRAFGK